MEIESKGVSVTLSGREIVHRVSVQVKDRQFVGLLGPNGSGKTTLLKSIYRVLKPSEGAVCIDGEDIRRMSYRESAKRTGVVSQFTSMSFDFSVEEMVLMGRAPHKTALSRDTEEDYRIAEEALRRVDMLDFRDRSFLTLSGGEKQRILLARALAQQVEILVLDEPTNHLDIKYQIQIMDVVKSLGVGVLAALHDCRGRGTHGGRHHRGSDPPGVRGGLLRAASSENGKAPCGVFPGQCGKGRMK